MGDEGLMEVLEHRSALLGMGAVAMLFGRRRKA